MREKYETLSLATLKELAKGRGMRGISTLKKGELIEAMLLQDEKDAANKDIAATPSVTRRGKGDGGARKKAVRIRTGEGKGGCRDCAGSGKGGNSRNVRRKRYRIRGRADRSCGHRRMAVCPGRHTTSGHPATVPGTIRQDG